MMVMGKRMECTRVMGRRRLCDVMAKEVGDEVMEGRILRGVSLRMEGLCGTLGLVSTTTTGSPFGLALNMQSTSSSSSVQRFLIPESGWLQRHKALCRETQDDGEDGDDGDEGDDGDDDGEGGGDGDDDGDDDGEGGGDGGGDGDNVIRAWFELKGSTGLA